MAFANSYRTKVWLLAGAALAGAGIAGVIDGTIIGRVGPGKDFWLTFPLLLAVFGLGFAGGLPWWKKLDDVQKSGQLNSWFWGGQIGAIIALVALVAATGQRSDYSLGGLAVFISEFLCFGIAWLVWRFRVRGPVE